MNFRELKNRNFKLKGTDCLSSYVDEDELARECLNKAIPISKIGEKIILTDKDERIAIISFKSSYNVISDLDRLLTKEFYQYEFLRVYTNPEFFYFRQYERGYNEPLLFKFDEDDSEKKRIRQVRDALNKCKDEKRIEKCAEIFGV